MTGADLSLLPAVENRLVNNPLLDGRDVVDDDLGRVVHLLRVALPCQVNNPHLTLQDKMITG